jgi:cytochrome c biogenesis protein
MSLSTGGLELNTRSRVVRDAVELLSSMRFSISLLTLICIASVIGTVVKQNEPLNNYVNQFGPFWAEVFGKLGLFTVYSAPWFLLILAFLVLSTTLCIVRNLPKISAELRTYKEHIRESALKAFHHKGEAEVAQAPGAALERVNALLAQQGWRGRVQQREGGTMVAARKGAANKLGYLAAHGSVVLICVGGLLDGDMVVRAQMALFGKEVFSGGELSEPVPEKYKMSASNPAFRGNILVPEGAKAGTAWLNMPGGLVLQPLPFDIELKRFIVEYYPTGMPSLFASEIIIHDRETGQKIPQRVEVNHPAFHRGVAIYQSSFDDGGSAITLQAMPLRAGGKSFEVQGQIGGSTQISTESGDRSITLEYTALRTINVENIGANKADAASSATDVRAVDLANAVQERLGSGTRVQHKKDLRNVGPSITYKLRDSSGQAREFHNYMAPVQLEGQWLFLAGVRDTPQESFRYLRIPADDGLKIDGWLRLRQALDDPKLREQAARRYAALAMPGGSGTPGMGDQLYLTALRVLAVFAGADSVPAGDAAQGAGTVTIGGLQALSDFVETTVPEAERQRVSEVLLRVLNGALFELLNLSRQQAGVAAAVPSEQTQAFMAQAVLALSDAFFYPAPMLFKMTDFTQVQASVFQVARAPGKTLVYAGSVLLILGVFVMLYVRERRLWVWVAPAGDGAEGRTRIATAMSTTRRTLETDHEFERLKAQLLQLADPPAPAAAATASSSKAV